MKQLYILLTKSFKAKKIVYTIFSILFLFSAFHTISWFSYTQKILAPKDGVGIGDLARLTCEIDSLNERPWLYTLKKKHIQTKNWRGEQVDIITFGDSFSRGGGGGINGFYQDYIETIYDKRVLNILPPYSSINFIEMIVAMSKNGILDDLKPKVIILESIERLAVSRLATKINWDFNLSKENMLNYNFSPKKARPTKVNLNELKKQKQKQKTISSKKQKRVFIINKRNYDCLLNPIYYTFSKDHLDRNKFAYKYKLKKDMFTVKAKNILLFNSTSVANTMLSSEKTIKLLNTNLNKLAKILKKRNIILMFLPAVDKYNLYNPYIVNNKLPKSTFFEILEPLKKDYYFINTKKILTPLLKEHKDVYYADDTHWNSIASKTVIKNIPFNKYFPNKRY